MLPENRIPTHPDYDLATHRPDKVVSRLKAS